ncbi:MAG: sigma 54-interacting transcriptional regulator [Myxococcota bacterium]
MWVRSDEQRPEDLAPNPFVATEGGGHGIDLTLELGSFTPADARRWWEAAMHEVSHVDQGPLARLEGLDVWWEAVRAGAALPGAVFPDAVLPRPGIEPSGPGEHVSGSTPPPGDSWARVSLDGRGGGERDDGDRDTTDVGHGVSVDVSSEADDLRSSMSDAANDLVAVLAMTRDALAPEALAEVLFAASRPMASATSACDVAVGDAALPGPTTEDEARRRRAALLATQTAGLELSARGWMRVGADGTWRLRDGVEPEGRPRPGLRRAVIDVLRRQHADHGRSVDGEGWVGGSWDGGSWDGGSSVGGRSADARPADARVDGWAMMRVAELAGAGEGDWELARRVAESALRASRDKLAREDLWQRWRDAVDGALIDGALNYGSLIYGSRGDASGSVADDASVGEGASDDCSTDDSDVRRRRVALRLIAHGGSLALSLRDHEEASRWAKQAIALGEDRYDVLMLVGRAHHAGGDVTSADLTLTRALRCAPDDAARAAAAGWLAQTKFTAGAREEAERYARLALAEGARPRVRLEGRNVLGKLLLAREAWTDAERHFAEDAYDAALAGDRDHELRARLNRAIAVLYCGRRGEAKAMLEDVRRDGERYHVPEAVAFALSNLAAIAIVEHAYSHALTLSERAIEVRRRIGDPLALVLPMTNLAELRIRLGLVEEAEQGLRFGLRSVGQRSSRLDADRLDGIPAGHHAHIAKVTAYIELEKGRTVNAARALETAIRGASGEGERPVLADCHRLAAAIALEDGDLGRVASALARADEVQHTAFGRAELAVLRARAARAAGRPYGEKAEQALRRANEADDPETRREAYMLLAGAALDETGDVSVARRHLQAARMERDQMAERLPPALRERFLARNALSGIEALAGRLGDATPAGERPPCSIDASGPATDAAPVRHRPSTQPRVPHPQQPDEAVIADRLLVGTSPAMTRLRRKVRRVAPTDATVLVYGPTGSGKELVAEAVHRESTRQKGPLVKVNCAALVETLLLSELFGHERGAFTGASCRRRGRFELADGGTLFLDEIGDISPRTQVALLRVLQDGTFERVGGTTPMSVDVRVVCATHRDLRAMVAAGTFREDLYHRLAGMVVEVPALRDHVEDLEAISGALLARAQGVVARPLSADATDLLRRHDWPGNVRELENALRAAALFAEGEEIEAEDLRNNVASLREVSVTSSRPGAVVEIDTSTPGREATERARGAPQSSAPPPSAAQGGATDDWVYAEVKGGTSLADMKRKLERACITRALTETGGNITKASRVLGMKRPRLSQLVKQYELASLLQELKS